MSMLNLIKHVAAGAALLVASWGAQAVAVVNTTTFNFSANCVDCAEGAQQEAYGVTAHLTLQNYVQGNSIQSSNFVSFTYDGSNLLPGGFTITSDTLNDINGSIPLSLPDEANFYIEGNGFYFASYVGEGWNTGTSFVPTLVNLDFGNSHTWSGATAVTEPASLALVGLGLLGLAGARRRSLVKAA